MKVLIVDDDHMLCQSLKQILNCQNINIVGTANNGDDAYKFCMNNQVDIILMDIRMPICDGVIATKKIKDSFPNLKIVILTTFDDDEYIAEAIRNGASAYILKTAKPTKIVETLKLTYEGDMVINSPIVNKMSSMLSKNPKIDYSKYSLGDNHIIIIELIAKGYNNKEISKAIHLSEGTIRNKISDILAQLNLRDRTQIAIFWHTKGLYKQSNNK
ncbi:response regulator transcription factor [Clostridium sp. 'deep sea']|uniref:response regulator transcription factor n=1 Tax=Clostridium sp. 'deep sea' TaxID=2779445 RepID=UPI0018967528|nr:response regulator transcription factor [Clostridium sp. 'deep sea']QOR36763.1 response regulator transcription factor [Clostridium sp. 'deep sea']